MKKIILSLALFFLTASYGICSVRITPTYVELDANKTNKDYITGSFNIRGGEDETIRFKIYPEFFDITNKGKLKVVKDENRKESLLSRTKFFPSEFTCKNGRNQKVRFTVTDLKNLPDGESRLVFFMEDVNTRDVFVKSKDGKFNGKIVVKTRVGVPVYIYKGKCLKKGKLDKIALKVDEKKYLCQYKISSLGNCKIRYKGIAQIIQGNKLISESKLPGKAVGAKSFIDISQKIDIPIDKLKNDQEYKLKLILTYEDENNKEQFLTKEILFNQKRLLNKSI